MTTAGTNAGARSGRARGARIPHLRIALIGAVIAASSTWAQVTFAEPTLPAMAVSSQLEIDAPQLPAGPKLATSSDIGPSRGYPIDLPTLWAAAKEDPPPTPQKPAPDNAPEIAVRKSYWIPALEIIGFDFLLNRINRHVGDSRDDYDVSMSSINRNLRHKWVTDNDPYKTNQLGHPYQGSMYHGFARSAGLDYWESLAYTFAGSVMWEVAGEKTPPAVNDQVASGIAGTFLGEALFRMANLVLEQGGGLPPAWREVAAAAISPATGFNRLAFGKRFDTVFSSRNPAYYSRLAVGGSTTVQNEQGTSTSLKRKEALLDFSLDYGLPGKSGYTYKRPFDYFAFQATASSANGVENLTTRGLLFGTDYEAGNNYRGIWGLYGSYDYLAPQLFRISSTALSVGTTAQWWLSRSVALQGTGLVGAGYAGVGTINGLRDQDYHYGIAPQALLALRLIFGDKASLDVTGREYFVSRVAHDTAGRAGRDNILRAETAFTWRIYKQHAIAVKYLWTQRDASYPVLGDRKQTRGTVGVFYTLLGHDRFGAYDWRQ